MYKLVLYSKMNPEIKPLNMHKINDRLLKMINNKNPKVGYIASETDKERKYFNKTQKYYELLGINNIVYFDLEDEYEYQSEEELFKSDVIHLTSGNTYKFLSLLKKRNMISKIQDYASNGGILVGVSAGSLLMSKTIGSAKFGDDNDVGLNDLEALDLIDFEIMPHWNTWDFYLEDLKKYSLESNTTIYAICDGEGIVIEDETICKYGNIDKIEKGVLYEQIII